MTTHSQYAAKRPRHIVQEMLENEERRRAELVRQMEDDAGNNPALGSPAYDICMADEHIEMLKLELAG